MLLPLVGIWRSIISVIVLKIKQTAMIRCDIYLPLREVYHCVMLSSSEKGKGVQRKDDTVNYCDVAD